MHNRLLLSLFFAIASAGPAISCFEPSAPYCASAYGEFSDEYDFTSCRRNMVNYESEVNDYLQCLQSELEDAIRHLTDEAKSDADTAVDEYNDAVASFNRRANN